MGAISLSNRPAAALPVNAVLFDVGLTAYILAALAAGASLWSRRAPLGPTAALLTQAGWVCHGLAIVVRGFELGRLPVLTLAEVVSVLIWLVVGVVVLWERRYRAGVLGAFVLPVVLALGLALPTGLRTLAMEPTVHSRWLWVHVTLNLVGLAALVLNFAGALMYLLQEHELKAKRPGVLYYRLPALDTLDRLTFRALTVGFPFLTAGILLGMVSAHRAWGSLFTFDPLAVSSLAMWAIYATTLSGRAVGGWGGRRAAYLAIAGFGMLLLTLGAGVLLRGKHGL